MKKPLVLCLALFAVLPSTAFAQIDLTWDNCILADDAAGEPPAAASRNFVCTGDMVRRYFLHGSYKTPVTIPDLIAMDISVDLQQEDYRPLVPFFHYEAGGCANTGLMLSVDKSLANGDGYACSLLETAWGFTGNEALSAMIVSYTPEFSGRPGWGRMLATIARRSDSPYYLEAGVNHYGFHLVLRHTEELRRSCAGCTARAVLVWNSATLYGSSSTPVVLAGPSSKGTSGGYCAMVNTETAWLCAVTPTRNATWGKLKSMYRGL